MWADVNGIRLHYLDHGGTGPTLVLAPGLTANAHSFGGLMRAGLGDVAHVLALDMRGRGQSDAPATGYTMEDHAGDVLGLLDALELERIVMGGHSFGGLLTYWLAANHPDRVERCVVIDSYHPRGEVDARCGHSWHRSEPALDLAHAPGAVHRRDGEDRPLDRRLRFAQRGHPSDSCRRQMCPPAATVNLTSQRPSGSAWRDKYWPLARRSNVSPRSGRVPRG